MTTLSSASSAMQRNILSLSDDILLAILGNFRRSTPSYAYRVLAQHFSVNDQVHSCRRETLLEVALTCRRLSSLNKKILFEDFVPLQGWATRPPFVRVQLSDLDQEGSGLQFTRRLYLVLSRTETQISMQVLRVASRITRLHLGISPGVYDLQILIETFRTLVNLETLTLDFLHHDDDKTPEVYTAVGIIPNLRFLSINSLCNILDTGEEFFNIPLEQLEIRDLYVSKSKSGDVNAALARMRTKHLRILAFLNCTLAEDCLRNVELPRLHTLRLHGTIFTNFPNRETLRGLPSLKSISLQLPNVVTVIQRDIGLPEQLECLQIIRSNSNGVARALELVTAQKQNLPQLKVIHFKDPFIKNMTPSKALAIIHMLQWLNEKGVRVEPVDLQVAAQKVLDEDEPEWEVVEWNGYYAQAGLLMQEFRM